MTTILCGRNSAKALSALQVPSVSTQFQSSSPSLCRSPRVIKSARGLVLFVISDFRSRWQVGKRSVASAHIHIKMTTKLQSNHPSEPPDIKLNGNSTTTKLKKRPHGDCQGFGG
ncbi:uncharacterized protein WM277_009762 isoform 1-T1 [Molossus nigricans]